MATVKWRSQLAIKTAAVSTQKFKFYHYWVNNELFDVVLVKTWGSFTSKRGKQQSVPVVHQELEGLFALIDKTRLAHGYLPSL